jgi:hypothetical protein
VHACETGRAGPRWNADRRSRSWPGGGKSSLFGANGLVDLVHAPARSFRDRKMESRRAGQRGPRGPRSGQGRRSGSRPRRDSRGDVQFNAQLLETLTGRAVDELLTGSPATGLGWLRRYADLYRATETAGGVEALRAWDDAMGETLEYLWSLAMGRFNQLLHASGLQKDSEIVLVTPGRLSVLPLHARSTAHCR